MQASLLKNIADSLEQNVDKVVSIDLKRGKLGLSLFYMLYGEYTGEQHYLDKAGSFIEDALGALSSNYSSFKLNLELSELGRYVAYLNRVHQLDLEVADLYDFLDDFHTTNLNDNIDRRDYDPFTGSLLNGYYFLSRLPDAHAAKQVEKVVQQLDSLAVPTDDGGLYWISSLHQKNEVFLGLSHGSAAVILFLEKAMRAGIAPDVCRRVMKGAITYIMANRFTQPGMHSLFPTIVGEQEETPLCWCYGDLGVGIALERAGILLGEPVYRVYAEQIFRNALNRRSFETTRMGDASLCYGAAGTHVLFLQYAATNSDPVFKEAADYWYERIFTYQQDNVDTCGFKAMFNQHYPETNVCFIEGISGIGITIIARMTGRYDCLQEFLYLN